MTGAAARAGSGRDPAFFAEACAGVEAYYSAKVRKYGATPRGVDWTCQATQELRFVQLLKICDFSAPFSLNDLGCGYGALCAFLERRHPQARIDYLGIDLSPAMISRARNRFASPSRRFTVRKTGRRPADFSVASGIMNVSVGQSRESWEAFVAEMLAELRRISRRGFAVNFVTERPEISVAPGITAVDLYCTSPVPWARYCERKLGCSVEILDRYGMGEATLLASVNEG
ncbi:MAG: class I SAM-dependent methyltransferase [Bradyrhizobium sp.]|nr:class I SAM-dependent methyltransferase [Bradyrhizobium sp.]